jgi:glutamate-1-semialdehyde 2,1-aminomutase
MPGPVTNWDSAAKSDTEAFRRFFHFMLENGVYLPPSQFEAAFLGAAHSEEDIRETIECASRAFALVHA